MQQRLIFVQLLSQNDIYLNLCNALFFLAKIIFYEDLVFFKTSSEVSFFRDDHKKVMNLIMMKTTKFSKFIYRAQYQKFENKQISRLFKISAKIYLNINVDKIIISKFLKTKYRKPLNIVLITYNILLFTYS